jgi:hypothetical protein
MGEGMTAPAQPAGRAAIRKNPNKPIILAVGCRGWAGRWSAVERRRSGQTAAKSERMG